jgi:LuxR family maltose regulon positive regulatory protein
LQCSSDLCTSIPWASGPRSEENARVFAESTFQPEGSVDPLPILTTKLFRPPVPPDAEVRTELLQLLEENRHRPLTLISAAAGYGKTTLASMWLERSDCVTAWLSLDERDNDLRTFLIYFVAAMQDTFPDAVLNTRMVLNASALPTVADLARRLLNDLNRCGEPFILALDDAYLVSNQRVYDLLYELLRHPLPTFHLVIITRRDPPLPVSLLRARQEVTEIRSRHLRFSVTETSNLLERSLQREISEKDATEWTERTEGWVTAITLAALSLRYRAPSTDLGFVIQRRNVFLQDFLLDEVLAGIPPDRQECLFATSLLDRFCAPICASMCQVAGSIAANKLAGEEFIQWLLSTNLFIVPLDDQRQWFRFHRLFGPLVHDSLRKHHDPDSIDVYHLRASRWFAENDLLEEAIQHALAGGDTGAAVRLVAEHRLDLMNTGQWHRLELCIRQFPEAVVSNEPVLYVTKLHLPLSDGKDWVQSISEANRLVTSMPPDAPEKKELQGEMAVLHGLVSIVMGPSDQAIAAGTEALSLLRPEAYRLRCLATGILALGHQMAGNYDRSLSIFEEAFRMRQWSAIETARLLLYKSQVSYLEGNLAAAHQSARDSILTGQQVDMDTIAQAHKYQGMVHTLRNELDQAEMHLTFVVENPSFAEPPYLAAATCALARIQAVNGRWEEADAVLQKSESFLENLDNRFSMETLAAFRIDLALRRGDIDLARDLANRIEIDMHRPIFHYYAPQLTFVKLWVLDATPHSLMRARSTLLELDETLVAMHRNASRIDVLALLALVCHTQGETSTAYTSLAQAMDLAEAGGFVRNFVDLDPSLADLLVGMRNSSEGLRAGVLAHIDRVLAAFPQQEQGDASARDISSTPQLRASEFTLAEPLTGRESEILRLLATELSPSEIADELTVATATVQTHIKHIYGKLDVHNRYQAVQRGWDLDLI